MKNLNIRFYYSHDEYFNLDLSEEDLVMHPIYGKLGKALSEVDKEYQNIAIRKFFSTSHHIGTGSSLLDYVEINSHMINGQDVPVSLLKEYIIKFRWYGEN